MSAEDRSRAGRILTWRGATFGEVALAAFLLCAVSGVLLVPAFDSHDGRRAIAAWLLGNPGAVFLRNVHYWTAQVFLVGLVLHVTDHLRAGTEGRPAPGVWLRLSASLPVVGFLMLSGFLLRDDPDAQQAGRILQGIIAQLPGVGGAVAAFLFGPPPGSLNVVYVHHAATATMLVAAVTVEHVRRSWPRWAPTTALALVVSGVALFVSPGLHDGLDARIKGPWYFLGLQEALHWTAFPLLVVAGVALAAALIWVLPRLSAGWSRRTKQLLLFSAIGYAGLCLIGMFFRGEDWGWGWNRPDGPGDLHLALIAPRQDLPPRATLTSVASAPPVVLGRPEGCLLCHAGMQGLGNAHRPESVGCASCHGGDVFSADRVLAHRGMIPVPGNLENASRTCGAAGCHDTIIPRVQRSIMTTMAGVIAVDRKVFGEPVAPGATPAGVSQLGHSAADTHLRQLCASCHLGQAKEIWGPIGEESRGGGCNACHLVYSADAASQLAAYGAERSPATLPRVHPALTVAVDDGHCFGCHSRSGRIALGYAGWHELHEPPKPAELATAAARTTPKFRQLDDGRWLTREVADVHAERGMACIDCHIAAEVMGSGAVVACKRDQLRVRCEDCHAPKLATSPAPVFDAETQKLLQLRGWTLATGERLAVTATGDLLPNVVVPAQGAPQLRLKASGAVLPLRAPTAACARTGGHAQLSCGSCHTAWAPRCASCHTRFEPKGRGFDLLAGREVQGAWEETSGAFEAVPPTLGIRYATTAGGARQAVVDTFVPGMIIQLDRNRDSRRPADVVFERRYAPLAPHTIRRDARSCVSCHNDPVALGYGEGVLRYQASGGAGRWSFTPKHGALPQDGLPADAWIGFLGASHDAGANERIRPFNPDEQRRILDAGACLTCHDGASAVMRDALVDFDATLRRRSPRCAVPAWR